MIVAKQWDAQLALEANVDADMVIPIPDSGVPAAMGYSEASKIPFELGIIRNHYVGRTFIEPQQSIRSLSVKLKHNANRSLFKNQRVILLDDSIVRGNHIYEWANGPRCWCSRGAYAYDTSNKISGFLWH